MVFALFNGSYIGKRNTGIGSVARNLASSLSPDLVTVLDPLNTGATTIDGTYDGANNSDSDGDGVPDDEDSNENNQYQCSDNDSDSCDDCSSGTYDPSNDGWDYDGDGMCDAGDADDDNDNVPDNQDSDDNNEFICSNDDGDSCDDCSSGYYDPENDGCINSVLLV